MAFTFTTTPIPGLTVVTIAYRPDARGAFCEHYRLSEFTKAGITTRFVQDNHSISHLNILRGLHFQTGEYAQAKLVSCLQGRVYDVAVDLRPGLTYGKHFGLELSAGTMLYIPEGFAHGFYSMADNSVLYYKCSTEYSPQHEGGVIWNDSDLAIKWPAPFPRVSEKDAALPRFKPT